MRNLSAPVMLLAVAVLLSGCSGFGKLFGGTDDTILPGQREDAIPGHASYPEPGDNGGVDTTPAAQDQAAAPAVPDVTINCNDPKNKKDPACADTSSTSSDGTFSDGQ
jgi:hypothetical protein